MLLAPPLPVALARRERGMPPPGPWSFEIKLDGWRALLFRDEAGGTVLQARSGRLISDRFPDLVRAAQALPPGLVLDGELVIWHRGRVDFFAVQRRALSHPRRAAALAHELPASYAAFDVLEADGADWRTRPYRERRVRLLQLDLAPPIQPVPATTDRAIALAWWERYRPDVGIEGLVVKHLDGAYLGGSRQWRKVKHWDAR
ncbi:RNA ligase family protein [Streptomyces nanshensis]|uniref:ATP-dependent DNA ligase n=1 Tax=Streptomyces nanshensis TaxID=518642 RepID=UPI00085C3D0D|nr:RNA ligase family protein [Streptomyces nanshensis]